MSAELQRIVRICPAFDCLMVQPCALGSERCGTRPGSSHGRHNAEMRMVLRGEQAELILVVNTGWYLPETPLVIGRHDKRPSSGVVEFHASAPWFEGQDPQGSACELWPQCYGDCGYLVADEPTALLVSKGSDAAWEWLEETYRATWPALAGGAS